MEFGVKEREMGMDYTKIIKITSITALLLTIFEMEKVRIFIKMEIIILVNLRMILGKEKGCISSLIKTFITVNGKEACIMEGDSK